jgi:hypothetical protein
MQLHYLFCHLQLCSVHWQRGWRLSSHRSFMCASQLSCIYIKLTHCCVSGTSCKRKVPEIYFNCFPSNGHQFKIFNLGRRFDRLDLFYCPSLLNALLQRGNSDLLNIRQPTAPRHFSAQQRRAFSSCLQLPLSG